MLVLTIKTDQALAEIALFDNLRLVDEHKWEAHRILADTIHLRLAELLKRNKYTWEDIDGVVCFKGPGSFTGLRIGLSVANALVYSLGRPVVATDSDKWQVAGIKRLLAGENEKIALPAYGGEANISEPKK